MWRLTARRAVHYGVLRVRGSRATAARKAELEEQFAIRTAEDVAKVLGGMKGAIMKAGQMLSFLADGLPPEAQAALATLQADVPPMAPSLAEQVVRDELGGEPHDLFLDWSSTPIAAASIGQVHRAVMPDGRLVAVKVQYPGVDKAIRSDLDNAELLYGMFASLALKNLDVKSLVDELRARMYDELDYRIEATCQAEFAARYAGHPFIKVPRVVPERSARRVLTSEWVDGWTWQEFLDRADDAARQRAGEVLFRFAFGSIYRHRVFNGDPHPGNYRFHPDGSITFLDFGLVKRWDHGELELLTPVLDAILAQDASGLERALVDASFLAPDHGQPLDVLLEYSSHAYAPFLSSPFTYTQEFVSSTLQKVVDISGQYGDLIRRLNMAPSYVILDRVVWGTSGLLGKLGATADWRRLLEEYRAGAAPSTALGKAEAEWDAQLCAHR